MPRRSQLYPFHEVKRVCDVGGGRGTLLGEILVDRLARDSHGTRVDLQMMIACDQGRERRFHT